MDLIKFNYYNKIQFNNDLKSCKYSLSLDDKTILKFNRGRALEFSLRKANGYKELELENVSHKVAGDININGKEYNIKSYKCELKADGQDKTEKIKNYIKEDASAGLIYIVEIEKQLIAIKMNWTEAEKFLQTFGVIESSNNLRIRTCDKKIYQWAMLQK
jgi:hypothetical protein